MPTPAPQGFPPVIGVPALYRIVRCIPVEGTIVTTIANASPLPADMLAEVQALYPSATEQQIKTAEQFGKIAASLARIEGRLGVAPDL